MVSQGNRVSAADQVVISTSGSAPVADAGRGQAITLGQTVQLDGTGSFDMDGDALTYAWSLAQVPAGSAAALDDATAPRPSFFVDIAGDYVAELTVFDGLSTSPLASVLLSSDNVAPVAAAERARRAMSLVGRARPSS